MSLDARTLLFSLILTYALTVLSLVVAAFGGNGGREREGMGKWAAAMFLDSLTWILVAARGHIPDTFSIIAANTLKAGAHALVLAAICEFQRRSLPRWQYFAPVVSTLAMAALLLDDMRGRFIWGGFIYGFQMVQIGHALISDKETRASRAGRLLLSGVAMMVLVLALRAAVALTGYGELAQPQGGIAPHPVQIIAFIAIMATALLGSIGFVLMVKERADREILHLAMTDSLTQIPNRRALMEYAEHAFARRVNSPMALLMVDVDHFKRINDAHGHLAGDKVLRKIARLLAGRLRSQDFLGRYGGEEFCVIAPDTDAEGAQNLAESLREIIACTPLSTERGALHTSVSIGVSCCPPNGAPDLNKMLSEADAALYAAKQAGRNRVALFAPAQEMATAC